MKEAKESDEQVEAEETKEVAESDEQAEAEKTSDEPSESRDIGDGTETSSADQEASKVVTGAASATEETISITCGDGPVPLEIEYDIKKDVYFEVDPNLDIESFEECVVTDFTTNLARFMFLACGAGEGTIKAVDRKTDEVLKTFHILIAPGTAEQTVRKGEYVWTYPPQSPSELMAAESAGVTITSAQPYGVDGWWGAYDSDSDHIMLLSCGFTVKGEQLGDYTVSYYGSSVDKPFYIVTYHVIENEDPDQPYGPDPMNPEETIRITCGDLPASARIEHRIDESVYFEIDPNLNIEYQTEDVAIDASSSYSNCLILANGAGEGTIKAINFDTGEVLKTFHVVISPKVEEQTVGNGKYAWTYPPASYELLNRTDTTGVSIISRRERMSFDYLWGFSDMYFEGLPLYESLFSVKGEQPGDYTVTYYMSSEDSPFYIVTYHVVDDGEPDPPAELDPITPEETIEITCGDSPVALEIVHKAGSPVSFNADSGLSILTLEEEEVINYTTDKARYMFYANGAGTGDIKAVDTNTGEVLKTFHIVISPLIAEQTLEKDEYVWTLPPGSEQSLNFTKSDGVSILDRDMRLVYNSWGSAYTEDDYLSLYSYKFAVKGMKPGDHTVTYYWESEEKPFYIVTYHVVDHDLRDVTVTRQPTCAEPGFKEGICSFCGKTITEVIPALDHTWAKDYTVDKEPTQTEDGSESIHCTVCGAIDKSSVRVIPKLGFSVDAEFVLEKLAFNYTGKPITPGVTVTYNGKQLVRDKDFTVTYGNNIDLGQADVNVTGIGKYSGTEHLHFTIRLSAPMKVTCTNVASGMKVSWTKVRGATSYKVYRNGKYIFTTSALEVTDKEVKYKGGTKYVYKVVATENRFGDSKLFRTSTCYRLLPVGIKSLTNPSAGKMTVTYDKSEGCYGYVVRYGLKADMSDAKVVTVQGQNTTSRTFGNMKKGKTYFVQVRSYKLDNGVRYYSGYCTTKTIMITR